MPNPYQICISSKLAVLYKITRYGLFILRRLGPALHAGGYADLKLMVFDDSTLQLPGWAKTVSAAFTVLIISQHE